MTQNAPQIRLDADALDDFELYATEQLLYLIADEINAITNAGRIYGQVLLPPDEAERKRQLMEGGA